MGKAMSQVKMMVTNDTSTVSHNRSPTTSDTGS